MKAASHAGTKMRGDDRYALGDFTVGSGKAAGRYASENRERLGGAGGASIGMIAGAALAGPIGLVAGSLLGSSAGQAAMRKSKNERNAGVNRETENTRTAPETRNALPLDLLSEPIPTSAPQTTAPPQQAFRQRNLPADRFGSSHPLQTNTPLDSSHVELIADPFSVLPYPIATIEAIPLGPGTASTSGTCQLPAPINNDMQYPSSQVVHQNPSQAYQPTMSPQNIYHQSASASSQSPNVAFSPPAPQQHYSPTSQAGYFHTNVARLPVSEPPRNQTRQPQQQPQHHQQNQPTQQGYQFGES